MICGPSRRHSIRTLDPKVGDRTTQQRGRKSAAREQPRDAVARTLDRNGRDPGGSQAMAEQNANVVSASTPGAKLPDGVVTLDRLESSAPVDGCRVFTHYNGPTDELSGMVAGMCVLDPGSTPHPPHQHPEEEFMIVAAGTGECYCVGNTPQVGPGAMMYSAGNVMHGITNTGKVPLTFYWSKWLGK